MPSNIGMKEAGVLPKVALTSYKALVWHCDAPWTEKEIGPTVLVLGMQSLIGPLCLSLCNVEAAADIDQPSRM